MNKFEGKSSVYRHNFKKQKLKTNWLQNETQLITLKIKLAPLKLRE